MQAPGILFVAKICKRFRLDKQKGMSLSQQHLISLKPQGSEVRDLEIFRDRVEFILSSLETSEYPAEPILRTWIYDCLKNIPKLSLRIDKYRDAQVGSFERSFQFLWQSMSDVIDEAQHDQNTTSVLSTLRAKVDAAPYNANPKEKKDKKEKDKKDKKDKDKKEKDSGKQRGKQTQRPSLSLTQRERRNPITQKLLLVERDIHVCFILQGHAGGTHARMCMMQPARQKQRRSQKLAHHRRSCQFAQGQC